LEVNLWEHGWISNTTCPNGRVDWPAHLARLNFEEAGMIMLFGRQGEGGGIFNQSGKHLSGPELKTIRREAEEVGIEVVVQQISADDPFFREGSICFPHGIPRR
jgi:hypothetical protein